MKKKTAIVPVALLAFLTGCDVSWQAVTAAAAVASGEPALAILAIRNLNNDDDESWWDANDQYFDWHWFPFN